MNYALVITFVLMMAYADACRPQTPDEREGHERNPLEFNIANIQRGKQFFTIHCVSCHGVDGRGDTEMREFLKTPPADLVDDQWTYGDGDEAIFDVIKEGRTLRDMPAFTEKLNDERIWQVISYTRYLGGKRP